MAEATAVKVDVKVAAVDAFPASTKGRKASVSPEAIKAFDVIRAGGTVSLSGKDAEKVYRQIRGLAEKASMPVRSRTGEDGTLFVGLKPGK
jgi:hypothetical protein